jgi:hypothetical protein
LNLPLDGSSNSSLKSDADTDGLNDNANDISNDEDPPFEDKAGCPSEYHIIEAEHLNIS